jgi:hypothetical protein
MTRTQLTAPGDQVRPGLTQLPTELPKDVFEFLSFSRNTKTQNSPAKLHKTQDPQNLWMFQPPGSPPVATGRSPPPTPQASQETDPSLRRPCAPTSSACRRRRSTSSTSSYYSRPRHSTASSHSHRSSSSQSGYEPSGEPHANIPHTCPPRHRRAHTPPHPSLSRRRYPSSCPATYPTSKASYTRPSSTLRTTSSTRAASPSTSCTTRRRHSRRRRRCWRSTAASSLRGARCACCTRRAPPQKRRTSTSCWGS